jgi:hypothetical protein
MACPVCDSRRARRACPAVGRDICSVCCGTKRLVEIACPERCVYLTSARSHPPATVLRQRERDLALAWVLVDKLPEPAYHLLLDFQAVVRQHRQGAIPPLVDSDVTEAAGTLAATLETASRGIIFEHQAASLPAQRLVGDFREALRTVESKARRPGLERDAALALRRLERAGREARGVLGDSATALLEFLDRTARAEDAERASGGLATDPHVDPGRPAAAESRIIIP